MDVSCGLDARESALHVILAVALTACVGEQPTDSDTGNSDDETCNSDDACASFEICEAQECVQGDRDNSYDDAVPLFQVDDLDGDASAYGYLTPAGDVDYFRYASLGNEWVEVRVRTDDANEDIDTVVTIRNAGGALHAWMDDYPTGSLSGWDTVLQAYLPAAGTWYITVEDQSTWYGGDPVGGETFTYELFVRGFGPPDAETDTVDDPAREVDITGGNLIYWARVNLQTPGDQDWISVTMPHGDAPLEIYGQADIPGSQAIAVADLFDADDNHLLHKEGLGPSGTGEYVMGEQVTYSLRVSDLDGEGSADHWFVVYLRTRDEGYGWDPEIEPNDDQLEAQSLPSVTLTTSGGNPYERVWARGTLGDDGDEDWFEFQADANMNLSVRCTTTSIGSLGSFAMELRDPTGAVAAAADDGDDDAYDVLNQAVGDSEGTWTFRLLGGGDPLYGPGAFYRCSVFITPFEVVP